MIILLVCWEMSRSMQSYDIVVVIESMTLQNPAPGVCQTRMPHLMRGVIIVRKYKILIVLCLCHEFFGKKCSTGCCIYSADCKSVFLVGIFTAVTSNAVKCGRFALLR
jgi:hypothetical protein